MPASKNELHSATERLFVAEAKLKSEFSKQGDSIAADQGYHGLNGMDAVYRYLIDKYHWLPCQVRSLSVDDLSLLLSDYAPKKKS